MTAVASPGGAADRQQRIVGAGLAATLAGLVLLRRRAALARKRSEDERTTGMALEGPALRRVKSSASILSSPAIERAVRDLYQPKSDGSRVLLVPSTRGRVSRVLIKPTKTSTIRAHQKFFDVKSATLKATTPMVGADGRPVRGQPPPAARRRAEDGAKGKRVGVNAAFFRQLRAIFRILIPRSSSKEVVLFAMHTSFLLLRTYLSLLVAKLDGILVRDLVSGNGKGFARGIAYWFALAVPSMYTNAMVRYVFVDCANSQIRYLQQKLSLSFRTRLTRYVHDLYLSDARNYYKLLSLDSRIEGADQFIATDITRFCDSVASLYSNVSKPTLDLILFNIQLGRSIGPWGSAGMAASYAVTAFILRKVTPAFGKLAAVEAKLEGDFRGAHSRLITNSEEIAFYGGAPLEKSILTRAYLRLIRHINSIYRIRIVYSMTEDFVLKYLWSSAGYCLIAIPVFFGKKAAKAVGLSDAEVQAAANAALTAEPSNKIAQRTQDYISNRRLLLSLADAGGRLMVSGKEMAELAGHTSRVYALLSTLHALNTDQYQSAVVSGANALTPAAPLYDLGHINGRLVVEENVHDEMVQFDKVPIVAPAPGLERGGEELIKALELSVRPGEHVLIAGPNGVGKTGVARVLAGLWPTFEGIVRRPQSIMFLPQRPYLSLGSLRDQFIYPHSYPQYVETGRTDDDLMEILEAVNLEYLPAREGGMDTRKEWVNVFSGGEKQRVGMARLFYFRPRFAVLDECTSAVSSDVEGKMYQHAKDLGITLITISHRPTLRKYHDHLLTLTGDHGTWHMEKIGSEEEQMSFERERQAIEEKLADIAAKKARLAEIISELSFTQGQ